MKIDPNLETQSSQATGASGASGTAGVPSAVRNGRSSVTNGMDKADLSSDARQFALLASQTSTVPDVRQDRVALLKSAIQAGTYNVSNAQIAVAMQRDFGKDS